MLNPRTTLGLIAVLIALALGAAACGSDNAEDTTTPDDTEDTADTDDTDDTAELPPVGDDQGDAPAVMGVCAPGEPDCVDTIVVGDEDVSEDINDLSDSHEGESTDGAAATSSGMTVDGGKTVSAALADGTPGIIAVKGHLFDDGTGPQLCEGLVGQGERYGCDGEHISIVNLDVQTLSGDVVIHDGLTYTEDLISLFGEVIDGSLVVDNLVAG